MTNPYSVKPSFALRLACVAAYTVAHSVRVISRRRAAFVPCSARVRFSRSRPCVIYVTKTAKINTAKKYIIRRRVRMSAQEKRRYNRRRRQNVAPSVFARSCACRAVCRAVYAVIRRTNRRRRRVYRLRRYAPLRRNFRLCHAAQAHDDIPRRFW